MTWHSTLAFALALALLQACDNDAYTLSAEEKNAIDTMTTRHIREADSLLLQECTTRFDSIVGRARDSLLRLRRLQIEEQLRDIDIAQ